MNRAILSMLLLSTTTAWSRERRMPELKGEFKPVVGSWAEYEFEDDGGEKARLKVAVVGKEDGRYWIEQHFSGAGRRGKDEEMAMKMLVGKDRSKPAKVLMKTPDGVIDMTRMHSMGRKRDSKDEAKPRELGVETVKTPAGKFKARKLGFGEGDDAGTLWLKEGVGPYGLVKMEGADSERMTLVAHGKDATSTFGSETADQEMPDMGASPADFKAMMRKAMEQAAQEDDR